MLAFTADDRWTPGIGDPTVAGWVTVAAYFVAALLCWRCALSWRRADAHLSRPQVFWWIFTASLLFLGVNKQLDLQTWFTLFAKHLAESEGWYQQRRIVQAAFIGTVAFGGMLGLVGMSRLAGHLTGPIRTALAGGIFLGCFILIRASSFHHVDRMLGLDFEGIRVNWILELGSISLIAIAAFTEFRLRTQFNQ